MDQYIGKILGNRYEILEKIGSGGMAVVYKAKCHWLNRFVAVKILKEELAKDEEFRHRFHEESRAVAMLSHPNIVSIYDVSRSEDPSEPDYIVMELIDGITLKQYMQKRGGALNWKESLHFITQIMKGLSHAHSRGIIHRDIKPHNIMVLRDGSVKVADFGIARLITSNQSTMTQEAIGSVHYISPEQAKGSHIDARSDIYSAGVVLYEMLTGRLPYDGENPVSVAIQHINSIPLSPRELDPSIPEALEEITMKAMASDVDKRYVSADAMLVDLEEFRKNPNISFDYTHADLLTEEEDEPTRNIGANSTQVVTPRPPHGEKPEETEVENKKRKKQRSKADDYDDDYESPVGGILRFLAIIAMVLLCLAGVVAFLWNTVFSELVAPAVTYTVPDVRGYTIEEARSLPGVIENGFTIVEGLYVQRDDVPLGQIFEQSPAYRTTVKANERQITVNVSVGSGGLLMPAMSNYDQRLAKNMLENMGLVVEVQETYSEEFTKGTVMSQDPVEGTVLEDGQTVTLVVSLGRELKPRTMIVVTGMTEEAARDAITQLGLVVGSVREVYNSDFEAGLVCYQSIAPGDETVEEAVVNLRISIGPNPNQTPQTSETPEPDPSDEPTAPVDPTVTETPGVDPTPDVSEPPAETTPPPATTTRRDKAVSLPNDDRETVTVVVTVGGVEQSRQEAFTRMRSAFYSIEGSGVQEVVVYIDGVEAERYSEDFNA